MMDWLDEISIRTTEDVNKFLHRVILPEPEGLGLGWEFHPDDDFVCYRVEGTDQARFCQQDAWKLNETIDRCFDVCKAQHKDIYKMTLDILKNEC